MADDFSIRLAPKNEGVEYRDEEGVYRFNAALDGKVWTVWLPGSKGDSFASYELTPEEKGRILPRIASYLGTIRWFGIFRRTYAVRMERGDSPK